MGDMRKIDEVPSSEAIQTFESLKGELVEIPEMLLAGLRFSAEEAASRGLWLSGNAARDETLFSNMYRTPPLDEIRSMRARSLAIKGAELVESPDTPAQPPDIERARHLREKHLSINGAVFFDDEAVQKKLAEIRSGQGHHDLGGDMIGIAAIETQNWKRLASTNMVSKKEVAEIEALGVDILRWAGRREDETRSSAREMEQRAWTYMAGAYNLIRDYAQVIYRDESEVWKRDYPSLFSPIRPEK